LRLKVETGCTDRVAADVHYASTRQARIQPNVRLAGKRKTESRPYEPDGPDGAALDYLARSQVLGVKPPHEAFHKLHTGAPSGLGDPLRFGRIRGKGFFA